MWIEFLTRHFVTDDKVSESYTISTLVQLRACCQYLPGCMSQYGFSTVQWVKYMPVHSIKLLIGNDFLWNVQYCDQYGLKVIVRYNWEFRWVAIRFKVASFGKNHIIVSKKDNDIMLLNKCGYDDCNTCQVRAIHSYIFICGNSSKTLSRMSEHTCFISSYQLLITAAFTHTGGKMNSSRPRAADRCPFVPGHI